MMHRSSRKRRRQPGRAMWNVACASQTKESQSHMLLGAAPTHVMSAGGRRALRGLGWFQDSPRGGGGGGGGGARASLVGEGVVVV